MTLQSEMLTSLSTPEAVRDRCTELLRVGEAQGLPHFLVDSTRLEIVGQGRGAAAVKHGLGRCLLWQPQPQLWPLLGAAWTAARLLCGMGQQLA